ncbi:hypothetical protein IU447_24150 [Nocardia farcinica]|uniref:hypothetical protein n=1 Tax=Nocardia farcinica TaxID=37329 RepID=UPI00189313F9|nr:hypothetical protein [Nocardia farcinica]MBF6363213.1 hypothetical protein [Nocardia farcinica]
MVYQIPAPAGHLKKNRFEFKLGDEILSLPKLEFVPPEADEFLAAVDTTTLTQTEFILGFIGSVDPDIEKKLREARLSRDQLNDLYGAWGRASRVGAGESSASERS